METERLEQVDPEIWHAIGRELERQQTTLEMIASENITSPAVMAAQGSVMTNKYAEGYPARRYLRRVRVRRPGRIPGHRTRPGPFQRRICQRPAP